MENKLSNLNRNIKYISLLIIFLCSFFKSSFAINHNDSLLKIVDVVYDNFWIKFKNNVNMSPDFFIEHYSNFFGKGYNDSLVFEKNQSDMNGFSHFTYKQYHQGNLVLGGYLIIHTEGTLLKRANGYIVGEIPNLLPLYSESAIRKESEKILKRNFENSNYTLLESPQIVYSSFKEVKKSTGNDYKLCYLYKYYNNNVDKYFQVIINSRNLTEFIADDLTDYAIGSVNTYYNGTQSFITKWYGSGWKYILNDESRGDGIKTRPHVGNFSDNNNTGWDDNQKKRAGASAHWALQKIWDYYLSYGRTGVDGNGKGILCIVENSVGSPAVSETNNRVQILTGKIQSSNLWGVSLDVLGHEFTHRVVAYVCGLNNNLSYESAALNEGTSDCLGIMCESFIDHNENDWIIGEDCMGNWQRSFSNPSSDINLQCSEYYGDNLWVNAQQYRHYIRSGVLRKWFYLISNGDYFRGINVVGIGRNKVAYILYHALFSLSEYSDFNEMKNATIETTIELYGQCSLETNEVVKAWQAVNVISGWSFPDIYVNCNELNVFHNQGLPYYVSGHNILFSNCQISNDNSTYFTAGSEIHLTDGFRSGTGYFTFFHAYITDCSFGSKSMVAVNYDSQNNNADLFKENNNENNNNPNISIFPNPTNKYLFINSNSENMLIEKVELYNLIGKNELIVVTNNSLSYSIDIGFLNKGIYILKILLSDNTIVSKKIIKE